MMPVLDARGLQFAFPRMPPLLRGLDVQLVAGEIVGLIGPPSSGKTVLLKLLAGLIDPLAGEVRIDGVSFADLGEAERYAVRRKVGMVFQNNALFDFLDIAGNVAFPLRQLGELTEPRVSERLHDVGLTHAAAQFPHELSGGMKKRASLARATITRPPICFYDEPTAGLDPVTAARIYALIQRFARQDGAAALIISNELDTLLPVCDRVLMLHEGVMIFSGAPEALVQATHPAVRQFVSGASEGPL